jgi:nitrous oxide reductase accessory protein NosL
MSFWVVSAECISGMAAEDHEGISSKSNPEIFISKGGKYYETAEVDFYDNMRKLIPTV